MINLTNIDAVEVVNRLNRYQEQSGSSARKISSASKLGNSWKDAGARSMHLNLQSSFKRLTTLQHNLQNSLSFSQTQAGALKVAGKILDRMSVLRTRASDETLAQSEIEEYNYEFKELQRELCELKKRKFNKVSLFKTVDTNSIAGAGLEKGDLFTQTTSSHFAGMKHTRAGLFEGMIPLAAGKGVLKSREGGIQEDRLGVDDANKVGALTLNFDAKTLKDNVKVYHESNLVFDSGEITGAQSFSIPYSGSAKGFEIVVNEGDSGEVAAAEGAKMEGDSWFLTKPAFAKDGTTYAGSFDQNLYAYNPDGSVKWQFMAEGSIVSSPKVGADGTIYFGSGVTDGAPAAMGLPTPVTSNTFYAVNPDGTEKWSFKTNDGDPNSKIYSTPAIGSDGTIYFGSREPDSRFYALDSNGNEKWSVQKPGQAIYSSPALSQDEKTVYVGIGNSIHAFNAADGTEPWSVDTGAFVLSSPKITSDGNIYVGSTGGTVHALDSTGTELWNTKLGTSVYASPAFSPDESILYIGDYNGRNSSAPGHMPAASNPSKLYAIDRQNGNIVWDFQAQGAVISTAEVAGDGSIYVGSADTNLYSLKPDGTERWRFSTGGKVIGSPSIDPQGRVIVGSRSAAMFMVVEDKSEWEYDLEYTFDTEAKLCDDRFHLMDFEVKDFVNFIDGWSDFVAANGSEIARLDSEIENLQIHHNNLEGGVGRLDDLDIAQEMARLNRNGALKAAAIKGFRSILSLPEKMMKILEII